MDLKAFTWISITHNAFSFLPSTAKAVITVVPSYDAFGEVSEADNRALTASLTLVMLLSANDSFQVRREVISPTIATHALSSRTELPTSEVPPGY